MARREKLIEKMRNSPGNIRFHEVDALLKFEGFVLFNQRDSQCTFVEPTDREIDQLVYELYGLSDAEIRIVEEATRS